MIPISLTPEPAGAAAPALTRDDRGAIEDLEGGPADAEALGQMEAEGGQAAAVGAQQAVNLRQAGKAWRNLRSAKL